MNQAFNSQNQRIEQTNGKQEQNIYIKAEMSSLQCRKTTLMNKFKDQSQKQEMRKPNLAN